MVGDVSRHDSWYQAEAGYRASRNWQKSLDIGRTVKLDNVRVGFAGDAGSCVVLADDTGGMRYVGVSSTGNRDRTRATEAARTD